MAWWRRTRKSIRWRCGASRGELRCALAGPSPPAIAPTSATSIIAARRCRARGAAVTFARANCAHALRIRPAQVTRLETEIDAITADLAPLESFVLRGGGAGAAHLHHACTVVRRAERSMAALAAVEPTNQAALAYLNRLSDLLFVMARATNNHGQADILWQPGLTQR